MPGTIVLNDGTELSGNAAEDGNILWLDIADSTFADVFGLLLDPENTETITVDQYNARTEYRGFTHLFYLREQTGVKVSAGLEKGES